MSVIRAEMADIQRDRFYIQITVKTDARRDIDEKREETEAFE